MRLKKVFNEKMYTLCWAHYKCCTAVFTAHSEREVESKSMAGALFSTEFADAGAHDQKKVPVS